MDDQLACLSRDRYGSRRSDLEGRAGRRARCVDSASDARYAEIPHHQQPGGSPEVDRHVVNGGQRPGEQLERDEPAVARSAGRRGERDHPSADRGHRLIVRDHDRPAVVRHRDPARQRVFAHRHLEPRGHLVQGDQFLTVQDDRGNGASALL